MLGNGTLVAKKAEIDLKEDNHQCKVLMFVMNNVI